MYNQMVVGMMTNDEVDLVFHALADATRRDIITRTMTGDHSVSHLASAYEMSFAAVQKHVAVLERAGLVTKRPRGREQLVRGSVNKVRAAQRLLDRYESIWRGRIEQIDEILEQGNEQ